jgi:hypothetical protein
MYDLYCKKIITNVDDGYMLNNITGSEQNNLYCFYHFAEVICLGHHSCDSPDVSPKNSKFFLKINFSLR